MFFTAGNLEENISVDVASATGGDPVITVNPTTILKDDASSFDLALTTSNLPLGEYSDIITLTSGDVELQVTVNLVVKEADVYQLVTNAAKLKAGDEVLIVGMYKTTYYTMTASSQDNSRHVVQVTVAGNAITDPDIAITGGEKKACVFTLEQNAAGDYAFNDHLNTNKYLSVPTWGANLPSSSTASYFSVTIDASTGVATVVINGNRYIRFNGDGADSDFKLASNNQSYSDIYLYKKLVLSCEEVTLPDDGAVSATDNSVEITWDDPDEEEAPAGGYRVTVTDGAGYNQTETTTETQIEFTGLSAGTGYSYSIVAVCGEGFESAPVTGNFATDFAGNPEVKILSPRNDSVFPGDVTFTFTTTDFDLDDSHLVKVEVKEKKSTTPGQAAAPVLKTVYTQASPVVISGLADGKYHVDLYM
ncbi:MAG: fibronectin type III domain-containing protein, partial [Bacteroidales bacterium]|nr:fibronectin type III domain-containing protein [Bacteroidales bacterium]